MDTLRNLRATLKRAFPNHKFTVTERPFGGGYNVEWWDGPTEEQVVGRLIPGTDIVLKRRYTVEFLKAIAFYICDQAGIEQAPILDSSDGAFISHTWQDRYPSYAPDIKGRAAHCAGHTPKPRAVKAPGGWEIRHTRWEDRAVFQKYREAGARWDREGRFWFVPGERLPDDIHALIRQPAWDDKMDESAAVISQSVNGAEPTPPAEEIDPAQALRDEIVETEREVVRLNAQLQARRYLLETKRRDLAELEMKKREE